MTDWVAIKKEYLSGNISQEALAKKYGVNRTSISTRAKKEEWVKQREEFRDKKLNKTLEVKADKAAEREKRLQSIADIFLDIIERKAQEEEITAEAIKKYTSAMKDIKDLQNADRKEQEARIAKLQKEIDGDVKTNEITIHIEGDKSWQV